MKRERRSVSWTREERAKAKQHGRPMFALAYEYPDGEGISYVGVGDKMLVDDIIALIKKHVDREKAP